MTHGLDTSVVVPLATDDPARWTRLSLGLACNTGSGSVRQMHAGRALAEADVVETLSRTP